jgi:hypothetical protein
MDFSQILPRSSQQSRHVSIFGTQGDHKSAHGSVIRRTWEQQDGEGFYLGNTAGILRIRNVLRLPNQESLEFL